MKAWYKSKTIWVNALAAALAAVPQIMPIVQSLDYRWYIALSLVVPAANVLLRSVTNQPIGWKNDWKSD